MFKHLQLENFRNHKKFDLAFNQTTVLVGKNGIGKSNVLEAMTLLSFCRSFREEDKKNLINYDSDYARINGDNLEIFMARAPRFLLQAKENGVVKKLADFVGILPAVIFSAETIAIITGSPKERRRFLDVMISQTDKEYFRALVEYKKIKTQRNNLLQSICQRRSGENELLFWNKELIHYGSIIVSKREEAVSSLGASLLCNYRKISGNPSTELSLAYLKSGGGNLEEDLVRFQQREIACGKTLFGPHRDDLNFLLNEHNMNNFSSRGEIRSAVLSLKISELNFIEEALKNKASEYKKPILLLDDIFSEFDPERRTHLGDLILQYQSLITSTEAAHLSKDLLQKSKVVELT